MDLTAGISEILSSFDSITLPEMEAYMLMDRVDFKYVFPVCKIPVIIKDLGKNYKALDIESLRIFPYHTTYYDTGDWFFFRQHITDRGFRSKVRVRKYEQTGTSFLEIKNRTNKMRTEKWRIMKKVSLNEGFDQESLDFIRSYISHNSVSLAPVIINRFNRVTLTSKSEEERVTVDFNISFSDLDGNSFSIPDVGIIEKKRADFSNRSVISEAIKNAGIYPTGFSKYCLGTAVLHDPPGKSLLKPKHLLINKIKNECIRQLSAGELFN
ncbi:MAG TPA: polyphosphate polymerase domain-containing protein [Bacteroidales bacterium]|nr:polyphosphate polymerase domain-containing protein [Bacteroidales bacterium]